MPMQCERDLERKKELEISEQREKQLQDKIDDWIGLIDDQTDDRSEFEKTLRMPFKRSERSH
jgi:hypothetical protein